MSKLLKARKRLAQNGKQAGSTSLIEADCLPLRTTSSGEDEEVT
jgi:hypothetical protein